MTSASDREPGERRLRGKTAVITGAGRGIGREIALAYAEEGADLSLIARTRHEVEEVAAAATGLGVSALPIEADVTVDRTVATAIAETLRELGRIDILVNNAGITPGAAGRSIENLLDVPTEYWDRTFAVNCRGSFLMTREALPAMLAGGAGSIIGITSGVSRTPLPGYAPYVPSKAALELLMQIVDAEFGARGIRANLLHPGGPVATSIFTDYYQPIAGLHLASPDVIRDAAVWLASDAAEHVHGAVINARDWDRERVED